MLIGVIFTDTVAEVANSAQDGISTYFGWFYILATSFFLVFALYLMVSRYGRIKLGPDDATPEFGNIAWFAMLFTAGMGIGLVFFSVSEPVTHFTDPPEGQGGTPGAAIRAMSLTLFHWGFHPWAIYIVLGLALGYFAFRKGLPMRPAAALYPLIGDRIYGWPGYVVDILAVFGTMFGLATSLGIGTQQINAGLATLFGLPYTAWTQILIIAGITAIAVVSVMLGISRGIRRLAVINLALAGVLMVFVLIVGPTLTILIGMADYTGYYLQNIITTSLNIYDPRTQPQAAEWQSVWTLFYWGWWISWSPFVGMFIARVSYGRTVRQFIAGTLFAPVGASIVWFAVFGGAGLFYEQVADAGIAEADTEQALYLLFEQLPIGPVVAVLASVLVIVVVVLFFATSSDSGSLVIDILTNGGDPQPVRLQRLFWAVTEGLLTMVLLTVGGVAAIEALQAASITTGLPFAAVLLLVSVSLLRNLRTEDTGRIYARSVGLSPSERDKSKGRGRLSAPGQPPAPADPQH